MLENNHPVLVRQGVLNTCLFSVPTQIQFSSRCYAFSKTAASCLNHFSFKSWVHIVRNRVLAVCVGGARNLLCNWD